MKCCLWNDICWLLLLAVLVHYASGSCEDEALGMENKAISDQQITSSAVLNSGTLAKNARLNSEQGSWCAAEGVASPYLQVDLLLVHAVCAVATQGNSKVDQWVETYQLQTSTDGTTWTNYEEGGAARDFQGNTVQNTTMKHILFEGIVTRYVRFVPKAWYGSCCLRVELYGAVKAGSVNLALNKGAKQSGIAYDGVASRAVDGNHDNNYVGNSCSQTARRLTNPWWRVDLGTVQPVSRVYVVNLKQSNLDLLNNFELRIGNSDTPGGLNNTKCGDNYSIPNGETKNIYCSPSMYGRYVYIRIPGNNKFIILCEVEVYADVCQTTAVGIADRAKIPDHRMTATSSYYKKTYKPYQGRLSVTDCAWEAETSFTGNDYLQVDLGGSYFICALATKGNGCVAKEWTTKYKIYLSLDNKLWKTYNESGAVKTFTGNKDKNTIQTNEVSSLPRAKFIRFWPTDVNVWTLLRVEVYGAAQGCRSSLGMEDNTITDSQITAQFNTNTAHNGRLYNTSTWCSSNSNLGYIEVDLGRVKTVTGVATQGHHSSDKWVKTYHISYKYGLTTWQDYKLKEDSGSTKTFDGNVNKDDVRVNWFPVPLVARYIRVVADSWTSGSGPCLRIDLYGCDYILRPRMTALTSQVLLPAHGKYVDVVCKVTSQSHPVMQWWRNNADVTTFSTGVIHPNDYMSGISVSTLRVNYTSADDIAAKYDCVRKSQSLRDVTCTTAYSCVTFYPGIQSQTKVLLSAVVSVTIFVPAAPTSVQVTAQSRKATIQWTLPGKGSDEGSISSYLVEYHISGNATTVTASSQGRSFAISGLSPYTTYSVRVSAKSRVGEGMWSAWEDFRTDSAPPEVAPAIESVVATASDEIKITWKKPTGRINGPLRGYKISYRTDGQKDQVKTVQSNTLTLELVSLNKWTEYKIRVQVQNDKGDGPYSEEKIVRTMEDVPSKAPSSVVAVAQSSTSVAVSWGLPPEDSRNGVIRGFKLQYRNKDVGPASVVDITKNSTRSKSLSGLSIYTEYVYQMLAYTTIGDGIMSQQLSIWTLQDAPSKPRSFELHLVSPAAGLRPTVKLTWQRPAKENGIIKNYLLYYTENSVPGHDTKKTLNATRLSITLPVIGRTKYSFYLSATTIKAGPNSTIVQDVPEYAPSFAPSDVIVEELDETTFNISWRPLPRNESNGVIIAYEVTYTNKQQQRMRRGDPSVAQINTTVASILLRNLAPCKKYSVNVRAYTSVGAGPYSVAVNITTSAPSEPTLQVASSETKSQEVTLEWKKPDRFGDDINLYTISWTGSKQYNNSFTDTSEKEAAKSPLRSTVTGLTPGTDYEFRISATTSCGKGEMSKSASESTLTDVPPPLKVDNVSQSTTADTTVNVRIWQCSDLNGPISAYQVIVLTGGEGELPPGYDSSLGNYKDSQDNNINYYITTEIAAKSVNWSSPFVIVGNGSHLADYENVELEKGESYHVYERAIISETTKGNPELIAVVAVLKDEAGTDGLTSSSDSVSPVAVAVPLVLILLIVPVAILLVWRRRRMNQRSEGKEPRFNLDPVATEASERRNRNVLAVQEPAEAIAAAGLDNMASEGIYCDPVDDGGHQPIAVLRFNDYSCRMRKDNDASLKEEYKSLDKGLKPKSWTVGKRPENRTRNRYANIISYDHSRVALETLDSDDANDYVNASYIPGFDGSPRTYIATQGPTDKTINEFWRMVWQQKCSSIIMLTNLTELGKVKCAQYWPEGAKDYGSMAVSFHKEEVFADYVVRTFVLRKDGISRQIRQFHFISWPDKGVPQYPTAVLTFRRKVRSWKGADSGPTVVHCSAGVGRTGTYIVIDAMVEQAKKLKTVDIFNYTRVLRDNRPHMVQTDEQYVFIHEAILECLTCGNTEIPVHNLFVNMSKLSKTSREDGVNGYSRQFQRLELVTNKQSTDGAKTGRAAENAAKNRFPNVVPLDSARVILTDGENQGYINASFVDAYRERNAFIMTQAPLESTIEDFWRMILQYKIGTIVMLNNLQEREEIFSQYWPSDRAVTYGSITVESVSEDKRGDIVARTFKVTNSKNSRESLTVKHHQHTCWPDKTVPASDGRLLDMMTAVQVSQQNSGNAPVIVHCSDGVGRSGTFCAIYSAVERLKLDQVVDVFQSVKLLRVKRPGAVETLDQYIFCYEAIQQYLDSFSDYANFSDV